MCRTTKSVKIFLIPCAVQDKRVQTYGHCFLFYKMVCFGRMHKRKFLKAISFLRTYYFQVRKFYMKLFSLTYIPVYCNLSWHFVQYNCIWFLQLTRGYHRECGQNDEYVLFENSRRNTFGAEVKVNLNYHGRTLGFFFSLDEVLWLFKSLFFILLSYRWYRQVCV